MGARMKLMIVAGSSTLLLGLTSLAFAQYYPPPIQPPNYPQGYPYPRNASPGYRCATPYGVCFMNAPDMLELLAPA
jgi:hypothetical protein